MNYRKLWESIKGPIPVDARGRPFEIHHVDGNPHNNDPENLLAVTIREHYHIHLTQEDWGSAGAVLRRINNPQDKDMLSHISKKSNTERLENATHNFLKVNRKGQMGNEFTSQTATQCAVSRVVEGTHNFIGTDNKNQQQVAYQRLVAGCMISYLQDKTKIAVGIQFGRARKYADANSLAWDPEWDTIKQTLQSQARKSR